MSWSAGARAIDIAAQVAHLPMRVYVMGDRAVRREPATPDDIAEMRRLTIEALRCRRVRLHHVAHRFAQDAGRRAGAVARCRRPWSCSASARRWA